LCWRLRWLFAEYIAKNGRHLGDAFHKRIAGLSVAMKEEQFAPYLEIFY